MSFVGAGSTFDNPFFSRAFYEYEKSHPGLAINYQSIGSGGGIRQFTARTVDFGATDVPMSAKDLAAIPKDRTVLQIPITIAGVAIAYNAPGAPNHLRMTPAVLADIFQGKIGNWNDPQIAALNPGAKLASLPILVVHRADGSGTTYILTDYLSAVSPQWKQQVGKGKTVSWTAKSAVGAKGNEGVAGQIRNAPGAIGYIELAYALQNNISVAALQNSAGNFVVPTLATVAAAAANKPNVSPLDFSIVNEASAQAYPIAGISWVLLYRTATDAAKQAAMRNLFTWMLGDGQKIAQSIDYVPLPSNVASAALRSLNSH